MIKILVQLSSLINTIIVSKLVKLLVADDDYSTADLYKQVLEGRGHDVIVVNRGEQCIKVYSEQVSVIKESSLAHGHTSPYDCVILDFKLPDINGGRCCQGNTYIKPTSENNHYLCLCIGNSFASFRLDQYSYRDIRKTNLKRCFNRHSRRCPNFQGTEEI